MLAWSASPSTNPKLSGDMNPQSNASTAKPKVAILTQYYFPSKRSGGPPKSLRNRVTHSEGIDFCIITSNRDAGCTKPHAYPYKGKVRVDGALVHYIPPRSFSAIFNAWRDVLRADFVWVNSLHSIRFAIVPILLLQLTHLRRSVIVSPRGELIPEHVAQHTWRKKLWHAIVRHSGIARRINWLATAPRELPGIAAVFPKATILLSPEIPPSLQERYLPRVPSDPLRVLYLGRVAPLKGLLHAVESIAQMESSVRLSIAGAVHDHRYGENVRQRARALGVEDRLEWLGTVPPDDVPNLLGAHDLLISPTAGESFGHSIAESLSLGRPVFVTDTTPWSFAADTGAIVIIDSEKPAETARLMDDFSRLPPSEILRRQGEAMRASKANLSDGPSFERLIYTLLERRTG